MVTAWRLTAAQRSARLASVLSAQASLLSAQASLRLTSTLAAPQLSAHAQRLVSLSTLPRRLWQRR